MARRRKRASPQAGSEGELVSIRSSVPAKHKKRVEELMEARMQQAEASALAEYRNAVQLRNQPPTQEIRRLLIERPPKQTAPAPFKPAELKRVLAQHGPGYSLIAGALRNSVQQQRRALRDALRHRRTLEYSLGNPTTLSCVWNAASVTSSVSTLLTSSGSVSLSRVNEVGVVGRNRVRCVGLASSNTVGASLGLMIVFTSHTFTFTVNSAAVVTPTIFLTPVGTYSLFVPDAVWLPLAWHAVPHGTLRLSAMVDVAVTPVNPAAPAALLPPTGSVSFLDVGLSGWGGPKSQMGTLLENVGGSQATITLASFGIRGGDTVSVVCHYSLMVKSSEGGSTLVDASTAADAGLNVPTVWVRVDT
jgi:hypothetical protein